MTVLAPYSSDQEDDNKNRGIHVYLLETWQGAMSANVTMSEKPTTAAYRILTSRVELGWRLREELVVRTPWPLHGHTV